MKRIILLLAFLAAAASAPLVAQVEPVLNDTIANSGTLKGTRIFGEFTVSGLDAGEIIVSTSDSLNARARLIAVAIVRNANVEFSADTISLGNLTSTTAKQWRFNLDTLLRGTRKYATQTAWHAWPQKVFFELVPFATKNAVQGGTSTVKRVQVDIRKLYNRGVVQTVFEDTIQNSGTIKGSKIIGGTASVGACDSAQLVISYSDSAAGIIRAVSYNYIWPGQGTRVAVDTAFVQNITAVGKGEIRLNWAQTKAILGGSWLALPAVVGFEFIPDASGNCELPVGGSDGLQPKWIKMSLRLFGHRS